MRPKLTVATPVGRVYQWHLKPRMIRRQKVWDLYCVLEGRHRIFYNVTQSDWNGRYLFSIKTIRGRIYYEGFEEDALI